MSVDATTVENDLLGQIAIVTGGGRGLGQAMAQELARAGAMVVVAARSVDQLNETVSSIAASGGQAVAMPLDVTDQNGIENMVATVERDFGPVDLLVNNAGVVTPFATIWEADAEEWWKTIDINLRGTFLCSRAVLPSMTRRRSGRIINIVSGASIGVRPYFSAYGVSKTALLRFTETMAVETKEYGITVFGVDPGWVRTEMTEQLLRSPLVREKYPDHRKIYEDGIDHPPAFAAQIVHTIASGKADVLSGRFISVLLEDIQRMIEQAAEIERDDLYALQLPTITA